LVMVRCIILLLILLDFTYLSTAGNAASAAKVAGEVRDAAPQEVAAIQGEGDPGEPAETGSIPQPL